MTNETIVAVYDTAAEAVAAVRDLENAGIPSDAISKHAKNEMSTAVASSAEVPMRKPGFWANLFGGEPEHKYDTTVYDRSLASGSTVVTVKVPEQYLSKVMEVLERYNPVDIDERASGYEVKQMDAPLAAGTAAPVRTKLSDDHSANDQTLQLAEETLAVGKRAVNRGTTRIRRYVVETPVEEQVNLRRETVAVERRPVTDGRPITDDNFTDKVVEMTETDEEAVVSKTARVAEELVIHKDATERTETVRDTVRREDAEITKEADGGSAVRNGVTRPMTMDPDNSKV